MEGSEEHFLSLQTLRVLEGRLSVGFLNYVSTTTTSPHRIHRILLTESHHNQAITWLCLLFSIPSCTSVSAKLLQSCLTLCDHMDSSPPGSSVHGILLARILEWVAMPSSRGSSCPQDRTWVFMSTALVGGFFTTNSTWEAPIPFYLSHIQWTDSYLLLVYTSLAYAISFWDQPQRKGNDWVFARKVDRMNLMSCMPQEGHWVI